MRDSTWAYSYFEIFDDDDCDFYEDSDSDYDDDDDYDYDDIGYIEDYYFD